MFSSKATLILAALPIALFTSGCAGGGLSEAFGGMGEAGFHDVQAGNWDGARVEFARDYQTHPEHPVAVFNMGVTYRHDGDVAKADTLFSDAVIKGKGHVPDDTLEPPGSGITVADHACARLHRDNRLDANCGDQIALEAPAPAPVAQAAPPAPEAQATAVPPPTPPKVDRN
jgi:hypothetical protein